LRIAIGIAELATARARRCSSHTDSRLCALVVGLRRAVGEVAEAQATTEGER